VVWVFHRPPLRCLMTCDRTPCYLLVCDNQSGTGEGVPGGPPFMCALPTCPLPTADVRGGKRHAPLQRRRRSGTIETNGCACLGPPPESGLRSMAPQGQRACRNARRRSCARPSSGRLEFLPGHLHTEPPLTAMDTRRSAPVLTVDPAPHVRATHTHTTHTHTHTHSLSLSLSHSHTQQTPTHPHTKHTHTNTHTQHMTVPRSRTAGCLPGTTADVPGTTDDVRPHALLPSRVRQSGR
jgi:hypothetical protein